MTAPLLHVGAPVVRQSVFGDWLIDDGSLVPQRASDRPAAFDEAAARSSFSPPVGDLKPSAAPCRASSRVATADGAGPISGAAIPPPSGMVPESCPASPAVGSGAASPSARLQGAGVAEGVVGATVEVPSPPREASGVSA
jgi:hypothetical protein